MTLEDPDIFTLQKILLDCPQFENVRKLKTLFSDSRLKFWKKFVPQQAENEAELVELFTANFSRRHETGSGRSALVIFAEVLRDKFPEKDRLRTRLTEWLQAQGLPSTDLPALKNKPKRKPNYTILHGRKELIHTLTRFLPVSAGKGGL